MCHALIIALIPAIATAFEWKGIFHTPDDEYHWGAQKVDGGYVDPTMKLVAIPTSEHTEEALTSVTSQGTAAMELTCEEVESGGTIIPMPDKCYKLVFDQTSDQSTYIVNATGVTNIAFFAEHLPTEFEATDHYFVDTSPGSPVDIEPYFQDPVPGDGHSHGHGGGTDEEDFLGLCVCQAQANGWTLTCSDTASIQAAVDYLEATPACQADDPPKACIDKYYVMQAHHDHCLHDELPADIEKTLHDYEAFYSDCFVKRQFDDHLSACPAVDCNDAAALTAAISLLTGNCLTEEACAAEDCSAAIKTVLMAHDTCPENLLPNNLETALHNHEDPCHEVLCNSASGPFDPYLDACSAEVGAASGLRSWEAFLVTTSALLLALLFPSKPC